MKRAGLWNICACICHLKDKHATSFIALTEKEEVIRIQAEWSKGVKEVIRIQAEWSNGVKEVIRIQAEWSNGVK
jgi:hypothetical protein